MITISIIITDNEDLLLDVLTTKASTNEIANLEAILDTADLPENIPLRPPVQNNAEILKKSYLKKDSKTTP